METLILLFIAGCLLSFIFLEVKKNEKANNYLQLELVPIGMYNLPSTGESQNLFDYYLDKNGNLYSINPDTWEINHKERRDILICSNHATDNSGNIVNSLRSRSGRKVTIKRMNLNFNQLKNVNGSIRLKGQKVTDRHINIL